MTSVGDHGEIPPPGGFGGAPAPVRMHDDMSMHDGGRGPSGPEIWGNARPQHGGYEPPEPQIRYQSKQQPLPPGDVSEPPSPLERYKWVIVGTLVAIVILILVWWFLSGKKKPDPAEGGGAADPTAEERDRLANEARSAQLRNMIQQRARVEAHRRAETEQIDADRTAHARKPDDPVAPPEKRPALR